MYIYIYMLNFKKLIYQITPSKCSNYFVLNFYIKKIIFKLIIFKKYKKCKYNLTLVTLKIFVTLNI